ncbi:hypothetical protein [Tengunoibacter tsumagoiensis]|uniref:Lipoprotein n=1 Tax=Tengunoibacter tsumagoiensis TaxID=2014871 RepID=A0A402A313_9CHLR|nr:hypothetical protein [Tengunoibacter tsumagoiensis]GCE13540.1 hypothetical protein KTT_33990 [Tengunoibacter tsumagoiensis]
MLNVPLKQIAFLAFSLLLLCMVSSCGPTVNSVEPQQTVTINKSFQAPPATPPAPPTYTCGAWASDNTPSSTYSTISIIAKLSKDLAGVSGINATATVHFRSGDVTLDQHPVSDAGGYVTFTLPLQGRQPRMNPATVDVFFAIDANTKVQCSHAFFTPR